MSIINKPRYEPDEVPSAADMNAPYDALATASANIGSENTASGWMTLKHIDTSAHQANAVFYYQNPTTTSTSYNSSTFTTISQGGVAAEVMLNYQPKQWEVLRCHMAGLVGDVDVDADFDYVDGGGSPPYAAGPDMGKPNYYAFRLLLSYNDGGPTQQMVIGQWGYSFTTSPYDKYYVAKLGRGTFIQWQTFQGSTCLIYNGATGTRTYEKIELQVAVFHNLNTVDVARHSIQVIRPKS